YGRTLGVDEIHGLALGEPVSVIARKPEAGRSEPERQVLRWYSLENADQPGTREIWKQYQALRREKEKLERSFATVMVMAESAVQKQTHLLIRGAYDKPGDIVQPGLPDALPPLPE